MLKQIFSLEQESKSSLEHILQSSLQLKDTVLKQGWSAVALNQNFLVFQVFFEPSTRTRVSFETAALRLGLRHSYFQMDAFTSLSKGESLIDSLRIFEHNRPDLMVIRSGQHSEIKGFYSSSSVPIICAGYGELYHPTQALLDLMTILECQKIQHLDELKLLFVGDVKNSRVAHSHSVLASKLGHQLAQCAEEGHLSSNPEWKKFTSLDEAMQWADVVVRLRTQKERGSKDVSKEYKITAEALEKHQALLMHPGPFLRDEDFEFHLPEHKQSLIWQQKENGHYLRALLMKSMLLKEDI